MELSWQGNWGRLYFSSGEIPVDWDESLIQNLFKGKGEALDHGNYHSLKVTD